MRPIIGVTPGYAGPDPNRAFCRTTGMLYCGEDYPVRIEEAGGIPLLLCPVQEEQALVQLCSRLDGLLLTGGEDVDPRRYGDEVVGPDVLLAPARDDFEFRLLAHFIPLGRPVLAICRGIQVLNVFFGGTLIQDIPTETGSQHHSQTRPTEEATHEVTLRGGSRLAATLGMERIAVNSHHHQAVDRVAPQLRAVGWSEDGIVEAVTDPDHPYVVGVQWHPERLQNEMETQRRLFMDFVSACAAGGAR